MISACMPKRSSSCGRSGPASGLPAPRERELPSEGSETLEKLADIGIRVHAEAVQRLRPNSPVSDCLRQSD